VSARTFRVGTRGSLLARTQTGQVLAALADADPGVAFDEQVIRTSGDQDRREVLGAFVREIQHALLEGTVDLGVHSLKDLPTAPVQGLVIAAMPRRQDPRDLLIAAGPLESLPAGAVIGAGSLRRCHQMRLLRSDLTFKPLVGNVDTRLAKLAAGQYDGIILAAAALARLGLADAVAQGFLEREGRTLAVQALTPDELLPAPGQGVLALECREDRTDVREMLGRVEDAPSRLAAVCERALLSALGGGCRTPVGAYATVEGATLTLRGFYATEDGSRTARATASGPADEPEALGARVALELQRGLDASATPR
jgi:hydroxymethylbilane synthase